MPVHDWQFWLVTALMVVSVWRLTRVFISTARPRRTKARRAALTIEGRFL
jgi:hypothetical protein